MAIGTWLGISLPIFTVPISTTLGLGLFVTAFGAVKEDDLWYLFLALHRFGLILLSSSS